MQGASISWRYMALVLGQTCRRKIEIEALRRSAHSHHVYTSQLRTRKRYLCLIFRCLHGRKNKIINAKHIRFQSLGALVLLALDGSSQRHTIVPSVGLGGPLGLLLDVRSVSTLLRFIDSSVGNPPATGNTPAQTSNGRKVPKEVAMILTPTSAAEIMIKSELA